MSKYSEHFYGMDFMTPKIFDFSQEYQGLVVVKRKDSDKNPDAVKLRFRSLYHYFLVQIVAELQKRQTIGSKGVKPEEVFHYLNQFNSKWPSIRVGRKVHNLNSLKSTWRNRIQKVQGKNITVRRQNNTSLNTERKRELLPRVFMSKIEQDEEGHGRKLFFKLNVNKPEAITFTQEIIPGLRPWKADPHGGVSLHQVLSYKENDVFWPLVSSFKILEMAGSEEALSQDRRFFRRTGPVAEDIKSGKVYVREEICDVIKALVDRDTVLILGDMASGKTVLARVLGYCWVKCGRDCCFLELVKPGIDYNQVINAAKRFGQRLSKPLLIVEDAHLEPNLINALLSQANGMNLKIVVTSRKPIPEISKKIVNYLKRAYAIDVYGADAEKGIISNFLGKTDWKLTDKVLEEVERKVVRISHGNLWLLSYALESLHVGKQFEIDRNSILDKVNKDLKALGEMNRIYPRILIALSVLCRYEILTDVSFLYEKFSYVNKYIVEDALENLLRMGEIVREETSSGDILLYGLPHPALAYLYFEFSKKPMWQEDRIYGDDLEFFCDYISSDKAVNGLSALLPHPMLVDRLESSEKPFESLDMKKFANRLSTLYKFEGFRNCLLFFMIFDPKYCREIWAYMDKEEFAQKLIDKNELENMDELLDFADSVCADRSVSMKMRQQFQ